MTGSRKPGRRGVAVVWAAALLAGAIGVGVSRGSGVGLSLPSTAGSLPSVLTAPKRIPTAARVLDVEQVTRAGNARSITITGLRQVRRMAAIVDRLPVQTALAKCPGGPAPVEVPLVRLTFRATADGPALAEARQEVPAEICHPLRLEIRGRQQDPREHGRTVLRAVNRIFEHELAASDQGHSFSTR
jgi:hypothetical protein